MGVTLLAPYRHAGGGGTPPVLSGTPTAFGAASSAVSHTFSYTVPAGSDRRLCVVVSSNSSGLTHDSVTYAGVAMTKTTERLQTNARCSFWTLAAPATGANDIVVTVSAATQSVAIDARSFTGAKQSGVGDAQVAGVTSTSITSPSVASAANEIVVCGVAISANEDWTPQTGQTDATAAVGSTQPVRMEASQKTGAAGVTVGYTGLSTNRNVSLVAVAIQPV